MKRSKGNICIERRIKKLLKNGVKTSRQLHAGVTFLSARKVLAGGGKQDMMLR